MRKYRQCPLCKSKKGFNINMQTNITYNSNIDFKEKILSMEKLAHNSSDNWALCLNCGKYIDPDKLDFKIR